MQGTVNQLYSGTIPVTGGSGGYKFVGKPVAPAWFAGFNATVSGTRIVIEGKPTQNGLATISFVLQDSNGAQVHGIYTPTIDNSVLAGTITTELRKILPSAAAPQVTEYGNVMNITWGGLELSNDVATAAPSDVAKENPNDVKTFVDQLSNACGRSSSLRTLLQGIVTNSTQPVTVIVGQFLGKSSTGNTVFIDSFTTNLVDVGQIGELPQSLPAGQQEVVQGELIAHFLGEREYAATHPGSSYNDAHNNGAIPAENAYRQNLGETLDLNTIVSGSGPAGSIAAVIDNFVNGSHETLWLDSTFHLHGGPVVP